MAALWVMLDLFCVCRCFTHLNIYVSLWTQVFVYVYVTILNKLFTLLMKGLPVESEELGWGGPSGHGSSG